MPEATVFIDPESQEPTTIQREPITEGIRELLKLEKGDDPDAVEWDDVLPPVADYHLVSEVSLLAAIKALQSIKIQGRCHYSRTVAAQALRWIGMTGDVPTDPEGMPEPVRSLPGGVDLGTALSVQNPYEMG